MNVPSSLYSRHRIRFARRQECGPGGPPIAATTADAASLLRRTDISIGTGWIEGPPRPFISIERETLCRHGLVQQSFKLLLVRRHVEPFYARIQLAPLGRASCPHVNLRFEDVRIVEASGPKPLHVGHEVREDKEIRSTVGAQPSAHQPPAFRMQCRILRLPAHYVECGLRNIHDGAVRTAACALTIAAMAIPRK